VSPSLETAAASRPAAPLAVNEELADALRRIADLLQAQDGQPFRVRAYRQAADTVAQLAHPARSLLEQEGLDGLIALPAVGARIAALIAEYFETGRMALLERLEGDASPETLFVSVPGLGPALAHRIHAELGVDTLEELELAAHDGRLQAVPGVGPRRVAALRATLGQLLRGSARRHLRRRPGRAGPSQVPEVTLLLEIDAEYRRRAAADELPRIAPRRFNPDASAWLPVLHLDRDGWSFTVLFSNTAQAHRLGRTHDWVVIFYEREGEEGQCTVVTEYQGPLRGQRVVRGRERECARSAHGH
jgi:hypothetical protein